MVMFTLEAIEMCILKHADIFLDVYQQPCAFSSILGDRERERVREREREKKKTRKRKREREHAHYGGPSFGRVKCCGRKEGRQEGRERESER